MKNSKAQAALEFLMTYGWALLIVLVAIGVLAYFGVLSPGKFLPATCTIAPGFACNDFKIQGSTTNLLTVIVQNGIGDLITSVSLGYDASPSLGCSTTPVASSTNINDGASTGLTASLTACNLKAGDRFKATLKFFYFKGIISHIANGQIVGTAE